MGSAKDFANRAFHFIGGLIITLVGIILVIMEFSSHPIKPSMVSFSLLIFGIGWIAFAFDKHKKTQQANSNPPLTPAKNNPPPINSEGNPPPMNRS